MKLSSNQLDDLREFVKQVGNLQNSRFGQRVLNKGSISYRSGGAIEGIEFVDFDEEDCRSFILTCRLLVQNNERTSIQNIVRIFAEDIADQKWSVRIDPQRWMLNDFLKQNAMVTAPGRQTVTNQIIFDTFLWGHYAHLNRSHQTRLRSWELDPRQFPALKLTFLLILQALMKTTAAMSIVISEWLATDNTT